MYTLIFTDPSGTVARIANSLDLREAFAKAAHANRWFVVDPNNQLIAHGARTLVIDAAPWVGVPDFMDA